MATAATTTNNHSSLEYEDKYEDEEEDERPISSKADQKTRQHKASRLSSDSAVSSDEHSFGMEGGAEEMDDGEEEGGEEEEEEEEEDDMDSIDITTGSSVTHELVQRLDMTQAYQKDRRTVATIGDRTIRLEISQDGAISDTLLNCKMPCICIICNILQPGALGDRFSTFNTMYKDGEFNENMGTEQWKYNMMMGVMKDLTENKKPFTLLKTTDGTPRDILWPGDSSMKLAIELHFVGKSSGIDPPKTSPSQSICGSQTEFYSRWILEQALWSVASTNISHQPLQTALSLIDKFSNGKGTKRKSAR